MTVTLIAQLIADGSFRSHDRAWQALPADVRDVHNGPLLVRIDHDGPVVGQLVHLERHLDASIWSVSRLQDDFVVERGAEFFASAEMVFDRQTGEDVEITGIGLVERTATLGAWPCTVIRNGLDQHGQATWRLGPFQQRMLERAPRRRRHDEPLIVHSPLISRDHERDTTVDGILARNDAFEIRQFEEDMWARRRLRHAAKVQRVI